MAAPRCFMALQMSVMFIAMLMTGASATVSSSAEDGAAMDGARAGLIRFPAAGFGRRSLLNYNACGSGSAPNYECKSKNPAHKNSTCCTQADNSKQCYDVGAYFNNMCGSCNTKCSFGYDCCSGVCVNKLSDANNCGFCGNKCKSNLSCKSGLCGYGAGKNI